MAHIHVRLGTCLFSVFVKKARIVLICLKHHMRFISPCCKPPKIDLTNPQNIVSYSAIWRVLHGNNFVRTMQKRFSMYLVITFSVIIFGAAKSVLTQHYGITVEGRLGSKFSSIAVLCIFSFFVSFKLLLHG